MTKIVHSRASKLHELLKITYTVLVFSQYKMKAVPKIEILYTFFSLYLKCES